MHIKKFVKKRPLKLSRCVTEEPRASEEATSPQPGCPAGGHLLVLQRDTPIPPPHTHTHTHEHSSQNPLEGRYLLKSLARGGMGFRRQERAFRED